MLLFDRTDVSVPLGEPMLDTVMEVRDETGRLVTDGEGQLFIGIVQLSKSRPRQYCEC